VADTTAPIPLRPKERASVAAQRCRDRSFNTSDNERFFSRIHSATPASGIRHVLLSEQSIQIV
jgi:hypothetical protein